MSDESDQSDEILALKSIYGEKVVSCNSDVKPLKGRMMVDVDPLQVSPEGEFKVALENNLEALVLFKHLTPITFSFSLPPDYPSKNPPSFSLNICWLSHLQIQSLSSHLLRLWDDTQPGVVLFTWFDFLQNEVFKQLSLHQQPIPLSQEIIIKITEYNSVKEEREFKRNLHCCPVCFTDKPGSQCKKLINCGHIFCSTCLQEYLEMSIKDGGVSGISCMAGGCSSQVHPSNVKSLVSEDLYSRYDRLLLQNSLDSMSDVQYCPREDCRCAVIIDKENGLGSCQECGFSFCSFCRCTYHGTNNCKFQTGDMNMYNKYTKSSDEEKKELENRYGHKKIAEMVSACQSLRWIEESTVKCPKCQRCIEKMDGCNKMTCTKCHTYFCWICGQKLDKSNPYSHYGDKTTKCYNKLFFGITMQEEEDDHENDHEDDEWDDGFEYIY